MNCVQIYGCTTTKRALATSTSSYKTKLILKHVEMSVMLLHMF
jgi:hypothetical protein